MSDRTSKFPHRRLGFKNPKAIRDSLQTNPEAEPDQPRLVTLWGGAEDTALFFI